MKGFPGNRYSLQPDCSNFSNRAFFSGQSKQHTATVNPSCAALNADWYHSSSLPPQAPPFITARKRIDCMLCRFPAAQYYGNILVSPVMRCNSSLAFVNHQHINLSSWLPVFLTYFSLMNATHQQVKYSAVFTILFASIRFSRCSKHNICAKQVNRFHFKVNKGLRCKVYGIYPSAKALEFSICQFGFYLLELVFSKPCIPLPC